MTKQYVILPKEDFEDIYKRYLSNEALGCGGVDNWEWAGDSYEDFADGKDWDEFIEEGIAKCLKEYPVININLEDK